MKAVLYIHGKGGTPQECEHYRGLFPDDDVIGVAYRSNTPWEAKEELQPLVKETAEKYDGIVLVAVSIGAYFAMMADVAPWIDRAYFISPVVDMERLIEDMMAWAAVSEDDLLKKGVVHTAFGEDLSYTYLDFVRRHPLRWDVPTRILYGSEDALTDIATMRAFAETNNAALTVMIGGEHWFHTEEQLQYLDDWIKSKETEMKRLRVWEKEDATDLAALLSNKKILDNLRDGLPYPYTEENAAAYIDFIRSSDKNDIFCFAITEGGKVVGNVGVFRQANVHRLTAEIGYYIDENHWGRGIATEAVKEVCEYVFLHSDVVRIYGEVFADNVGSCRVLEKVGFHCEGILKKDAVKNGEIKDVKMYALLKEDLSGRRI